MQVVINLLSNAAKFCGSQDGRVKSMIEQRATDKNCKGREALVSVTSMDWALWLIPAALVLLILWGNPLLAIITGAGLSLTDLPLGTYFAFIFLNIYQVLTI